MSKRTGPTNPVTQELIQSLRKECSSSKAALWGRIADELERSTRSRRAVNVSRIARFTKANEIVIVPGKVLGSGSMPHSITVAALSFSSGARARIEESKGKAILIAELLKQKPKAKDLKVIG